MTLASIVLAVAVYDCPARLDAEPAMLWQGCPAPVSGLLYTLGHADRDEAADRAATRAAAVLRECAKELETERADNDATWLAAGVGLVVGAALGWAAGGGYVGQ